MRGRARSRIRCSTARSTLSSSRSAARSPWRRATRSSAGATGIRGCRRGTRRSRRGRRSWPRARRRLDPRAATMKKHHILLGGVIALSLLGGAEYAAWWYLHGRYHETTDDAYVGGNLVQITPQVAGTVLAIYADDTEYVDSGKPLVSLDKADAQIMVAQAEAQLAKTVRSVRNLRATSTEGEAN